MQEAGGPTNAHLHQGIKIIHAPFLFVLEETKKTGRVGFRDCIFRLYKLNWTVMMMCGERKWKRSLSHCVPVSDVKENKRDECTY